MSMRVSLLAAVAVLGAASTAQAQSFYHYECVDGSHFEVGFYPDTKAAFLQLDGKSLQLPKRFSLISQRFKKDGVSLAMRGEGKAILKRPAAKTTTCEIK